LGVGGIATFAAKAEFDDDVCVSGNTILVGNLTVGGTTTIGGATSIAGALSVGGATNLLSTATITGNTGFLGTIRVSGNCSLEGQLQLTKSAAAVVCATAINGVTSVSLAFGSAQNFFTSVTAAHTLAQPTGCRTGQTGSIFLVQQGGSGTMAYNADWKFIDGTDPTMSTSSGSTDRLDYIIVSASSDGVGGIIQAILSKGYS
jgi:hypothetical protein